MAAGERDRPARTVDHRALASVERRRAGRDRDGRGLRPVAGRDRRARCGPRDIGTGLGDVRGLAAGVREVILGIGGSATTDGGLGMLAALSMDYAPRPDDADPPSPRALDEVDLRDLDPDLSEIACPSPAMSRTRSSGRPVRPRSTAPRRARRPTRSLSSTAGSRIFADAPRERLGPAATGPRRPWRRRRRRRRVRASRHRQAVRWLSPCAPAWTW